MTQMVPDKNVIDVTQDAVLSAASNVVDVLENTVHELGAGAEPYYMHAEFWVGMAFVVAVVALSRPVGSMILRVLKARGEAIATRINDASNLKMEAQKMLADYERKFRNVEKEVADILAKSEQRVELIRSDTLKKLEADIEIKERDVKTRLKNAVGDAAKDVAKKTTELTMSTVRKILNDSLDSKALDKLISSSIDNLDKIA